MSDSKEEKKARSDETKEEAKTDLNKSEQLEEAFGYTKLCQGTQWDWDKAHGKTKNAPLVGLASRSIIPPSDFKQLRAFTDDVSKGHNEWLLLKFRENQYKSKTDWIKGAIEGLHDVRPAIIGKGWKLVLIPSLVRYSHLRRSFQRNEITCSFVALLRQHFPGLLYRPLKHHDALLIPTNKDEAEALKKFKQHVDLFVGFTANPDQPFKGGWPIQLRKARQSPPRQEDASWISTPSSSSLSSMSTSSVSSTSTSKTPPEASQWSRGDALRFTRQHAKEQTFSTAYCALQNFASPLNWQRLAFEAALSLSGIWIVPSSKRPLVQGLQVSVHHSRVSENRIEFHSSTGTAWSKDPMRTDTDSMTLEEAFVLLVDPDSSDEKRAKIFPQNAQGETQNPEFVSPLGVNGNAQKNKKLVANLSLASRTIVQMFDDFILRKKDWVELSQPKPSKDSGQVDSSSERYNEEKKLRVTEMDRFKMNLALTISNGRRTRDDWDTCHCIYITSMTLSSKGTWNKKADDPNPVLISEVIRTEVLPQMFSFFKAMFVRMCGQNLPALRLYTFETAGRLILFFEVDGKALTSQIRWLLNPLGTWSIYRPDSSVLEPISFLQEDVF
jgi:hypothetical protein